MSLTRSTPPLPSGLEAVVSFVAGFHRRKHRFAELGSELFFIVGQTKIRDTPFRDVSLNQVVCHAFGSRLTGGHSVHRSMAAESDVYGTERMRYKVR